MDKRTFLKNSLIGTVAATAAPFAAYPVTLLQEQQEDNIEIIDEVRKQFEKELKKIDLSERAYKLCMDNKLLYRKYAEEIIEEEKNSEYAYYMFINCISSREWTEKIIEENKDYYHAYRMICLNCGSDREWAEKIIEKRKNAHYAYLMCSLGSSREWAEKIIEEQKSNHFAFYMTLDCGSSKEWHQSVRKSEYLSGIEGKSS